MPTYTRLQVGLFYTALICEERMVEDILKIVQLIDQDNFGVFLEKFNSVLLCFHRVKGQYFERLVQVMSFLFDCVGEKISATITLFLRNAYFQENSPEMLGYINFLLDFLIQKKERLSEKLEDYWVRIFYKLIRMMSVTLLYKELSDWNGKIILLLRYAWDKHRRTILAGGRELFRAMQEVIKVPELNFLFSELRKEDESGGGPYYRKMLYNMYKEKDTLPGGLIIMQIPPFIEQYTIFVLNTSSKQNFNKHLGWMLDKLDIGKSTISEYVLVDFVRYILICTDNVHSGHSGEKVQRWYVLGWILMFLKSDVFKMLAKQALFIDWLYYKGESGWFKVFEPVWQLIINSITKYKELSEEMLDFLLLFSKEYDPTDNEGEQNVSRVFELFKHRNVTTLENLMDSEHLTPGLKYRLEGFINAHQGNASGQEKSLFQFQFGDFVEGETMNIEGSNKKLGAQERLSNPTASGDGLGPGESKIDKYLTDNLYYNSEHHHGKINILEKETALRTQARLVVLEKMGETIPLFIRELPAFQSFGKEPSYANLSQLLREIFDLAQSMATKAYSPILVDQLSQDQIIKETVDFVLGLYDDFLSEELNLRDAVEYDDIVKKVSTRNFDIDKDQFLVAGLSIFLFMTLSKLYSENLNYYQMMEKLVSSLFEKVPTLYLEFLIFLSIIDKDDTSMGHTKRLQTIFQGMYFDKMCELINRVCAHIEGFKEILSGTLKYAYVNLSSELILPIVQVLLLSVVKQKGGEYFKMALLFLMKVFNPKLGFELEIGKTFKNLSPVYRQHLKFLILECTKPNAGAIQGSFWSVHKIMTQE